MEVFASKSAENILHRSGMALGEGPVERRGRGNGRGSLCRQDADGDLPEFSIYAGRLRFWFEIFAGVLGLDGPTGKFA